MTTRWMIYGGNGHTGARLAQRAILRGARPILAGRDEAAIAATARGLACPTRTLDLADRTERERALDGVELVVNCAGPFSRTALPLARACVRSGAHYLDVSGEVDVIEAFAAVDGEARAAGVLVVPGVGYAHTDALATWLSREVDSPRSVAIALRRFGPASRGTLFTMVEGLALGGRLRRNGRLVSSPEGALSTTVPFPSGAAHCASMTWGDLALAHRSTGAADVTVYMGTPSWLTRVVPSVLRLGRAVMRRRLARGLVEAWIGSVLGPRLHSCGLPRMEYWARVEGSGGRESTATMTTPNIYDLTLDAVLAAVERVRTHQVSPRGFHTPASAFGIELGLSLPGVVVERRS